MARLRANTAYPNASGGEAQRQPLGHRRRFLWTFCTEGPCSSNLARVTSIDDDRFGWHNGSVPCLILLYPEADAGKRFPFGGGAVVLGRDANCDIQIDLQSISRRHARIALAADGWCVEDLESTNGVYVNDVPVTRATLREPDFLRLGAVIFKFLDSGDMPPPSDGSDSGGGGPRPTQSRLLD